jgi:hypothetical protein
VPPSLNKDSQANDERLQRSPTATDSVLSPIEFVIYVGARCTVPLPLNKEVSIFIQTPSFRVGQDIFNQGIIISVIS